MLQGALLACRMVGQVGMGRIEAMVEVRRRHMTDASSEDMGVWVSAVIWRGMVVVAKLFSRVNTIGAGSVSAVAENVPFLEIRLRRKELLSWRG